jgi:WD40 repeat protein
MSPEQHRGETKDIGVTSDVWALGVILYELCTGRLPFLGESRREFQRAILETEPPRPRELNRFIDPDLEAITLKCLEKDAARRYESAAALADDLARCRIGLPVSVRPITHPERAWRWVRRHPAPAGLIGLAAIILIGVITYLVHQGRLDREEKIRAAKDAFEKGVALNKQGDAGQGMLWLARSFELAPDQAEELRQEILEKAETFSRQICPLHVAFPMGSPVLAMALSPDGKTLLTGHENGTAQLIDAVTGQPVHEPLPHPNRVLAVAFGPDGQTVLTGCLDKHVRLWDITPGAARYKLRELDHGGAVFAVAYSPCGKIFFSGGDGMTVKIWDADSDDKLGELPTDEKQVQVQALTVNSDGMSIWVGISDPLNASFGVASWWDLETWQRKDEPFSQRSPVVAMASSPDERAIVTGNQGEALIWDVGNHNGPRRPHLFHGAAVEGVAYSLDGKMILTSGQDKCARLWDATLCKSVAAPLRHPNWVRCVAFGPQQTHTFFSGCRDGAVRVWKLPAPLKVPSDHFTLWSQVLTGTELGEAGMVRSLSVGEWLERRKQLDELTKRAD